MHAIEGYVKRAGCRGVVLGLSGGIDSSLTASLCTKALGGENVLGLLLPDKTTSKADISLAKRIARHFGFGFDIVDMTSITTRIFKTLPVYDPLNLVSAGNVKARIRMLILYYYANRQGRLVVGTSDRSELMIGYFTKYGDAGALACGDISFDPSSYSNGRLRTIVLSQLSTNEEGQSIWVPGVELRF